MKIPKEFFLCCCKSLDDIKNYANEIQDENVMNDYLLSVAKIQDEHKPYVEYLGNGYRFSTENINAINSVSYNLGLVAMAYPLDLVADYIDIEAKNVIDNDMNRAEDFGNQFLHNHDLFYYFMYMKIELLAILAYCMVYKKDNIDMYNNCRKVYEMYIEYYYYIRNNDKDSLHIMEEEWKSKYLTEVKKS